MTTASDLAQRLDSKLIPFLFGDCPDRALISGRGSRNVTFLRYLLVWLMRYAFDVEEHVVKVIFGKNRSSVADGVNEFEDMRLSDPWDAICAEVSEWVQTGENLRTKIMAGLQTAAKISRPSGQHRTWRNSDFGEGFFRAGLKLQKREEDQGGFIGPNEEEIVREAEAHWNRERRRKEEAKKRAKEAADRKRLDAQRNLTKAIGSHRTPDNKKHAFHMQTVLRQVASDPDIRKALGAVLVVDIPPGPDVSNWIKPEVPLVGNECGARFYTRPTKDKSKLETGKKAKSGKWALERADSVIREAFKKHGFSALNFGIAPMAGEKESWTVLYRLKPVLAKSIGRAA